MQAFNYNIRGKLLFNLLPFLIVILFAISAFGLSYASSSMWWILLLFVGVFLTIALQASWIVNINNLNIQADQNNLYFSGLQSELTIPFATIAELKIDKIGGWGAQQYYTLKITTHKKQLTLLFHDLQVKYTLPYLLNEIANNRRCDIIDKKELLEIMPNRKEFYLRD